MGFARVSAYVDYIPFCAPGRNLIECLRHVSHASVFCILSRFRDFVTLPSGISEGYFRCRILPPGRQTALLDIHVPDGKGPFPGAIVVHGGGFDEGTKKSHVGPVLEVLTKAGFAWFSIDYRMAPAYHFPQPVEDVDNAIRWVKKNAAAYNVDASKIALTRRIRRRIPDHLRGHP